MKNTNGKRDGLHFSSLSMNLKTIPEFSPLFLAERYYYIVFISIILNSNSEKY